MSDTAIKVQDVSKLYRLGQVGTGTVKQDLKRFWYNLRGMDDPFAKIGSVNDRTKRTDSEWVWALKDINFEVKHGEVLGIIGRNGAGKSTLLKILSKITAPTTGEIRINGRIASLLEVGTGFHPDLSGRENIFLNGAILGMRKWEIQKKFDEIVEFAGVEAYIDTPVKRYSSGMYVRLAFAVAAFLEPEILIIDEVLAVGDAEFQKKCLGRMKDVSLNEGRTVLFVSHNMPSIKSLCSNAILLENGQLVALGKTDEIVKEYLSEKRDEQSLGEVIVNSQHRRYECTRELEFYSVSLINTLYDNCLASSLSINIKVQLNCNISIRNFRIAGSIFSEEHEKLGTFFSNDLGKLDAGESTSVSVEIKDHNLAKGKYYFAFSVGTGNEETGNVEYDIIYEVLQFNITHKEGLKTPLVKWPKDWGSFSFKANAIKIHG